MLAMPVAPTFAQAPAGGNTPPTALTPAQTQQIQQMQAQMEMYQDAIQQMEAHIYLGRDKLLHLNVKSGDEIGIDPEIFAQLKAALDHTNDLLLERQINIGEVAFSNNRNIFGREVALQRVDSRAIEGFSSPGLSCAGRTTVRWHWYGPRWYLDECKTQALIGGIAMGAGAAAIASFLGVNIPADVIAGVLTFVGGWVVVVDGWGGNHGIWIQELWYPVRFGWIGHQ